MSELSHWFALTLIGMMLFLVLLAGLAKLGTWYSGRKFRK